MITEIDVIDIIKDVFQAKPSKEKPLMFFTKGCHFKNDGENLSVLMDDDTYRIMTGAELDEVVKLMPR
jgi:hypothetical protein